MRKIAEGKDRSKNDIVFGEPEEQGENVDSKVKPLLETLQERPHTTDCSRIGQNKLGMPRPIQFNFKVKRSDSVHQILRKAKQLKDTEGYRSLYFCR